MLFTTFITYFLASSAAFSHGVGLSFFLSPKRHMDAGLYKIAIKAAAASFLTVALLWFPFSRPQFSAALSAFLPVIAAAISFVLGKALSTLLPDSFTESRLALQESLFVFASAFLALKEGSSFFDALVISLSCSASLLLLLFLLAVVLSRLSLLPLPAARLRLPLLMVLLGIFSLIPLLFDIILPAGIP